MGRAMPLPFHVVMPKILKCAALCGKRDCVPVIKLVVWLAVRDFPGLPERSYVVPRVVIKGYKRSLRGKREDATLLALKMEEEANIEKPGQL